MKLYDVCNDYSLVITEEVPTKGTVRWYPNNIIVNGEKIEVELGYSRKHKELHYLRTNVDTDLTGKRIS